MRQRRRSHGAVLLGLSVALGTVSGGDFSGAQGSGSLGILQEVFGSEGGSLAASAAFAGAGSGKSGGKLSPMAEVAKVLRNAEEEQSEASRQTKQGQQQQQQQPHVHSVQQEAKRGLEKGSAGTSHTERGRNGEYVDRAAMPLSYVPPQQIRVPVAASKASTVKKASPADTAASSSRRHPVPEERPHVTHADRMMAMANDREGKIAQRDIGLARTLVAEADDMKEAGNTKEAQALQKEGDGLEKAARAMEDAKAREEAKRRVLDKRISALDKRLSSPLQTASVPRDADIKQLHLTATQESWKQRNKGHWITQHVRHANTTFGERPLSGAVNRTGQVRDAYHHI
ncbi:hypothetical protein T484DRAFT_2316022 [Baffinella frigidus]|nr:hypothetical protein T484DRAFT_2316022 [Cryptophyta sp. CCMP2293]